ncbi:SNF2 helicase-associated domain-containing protein [Streptomyces sp. NPDC006274]|uniref:SNF2 helicase-associated domain-containing protein n=1 Tax=unclassified Streptomyces TaxID=2593676 RepID=UPI0033BBD653
MPLCAVRRTGHSRNRRCPPLGDTPFSLDDLLDGRWQMSLGDAGLSDQNVDDIGRAPRPLAEVRDQWVPVDKGTARRAAGRSIGPISSAQALRASLTGHIDIDGQAVPCDHAGGRHSGVVVGEGPSTPPQGPTATAPDAREFAPNRCAAAQALRHPPGPDEVTHGAFSAPLARPTVFA